jgi:L-amino acid N-acyltransferase YncA
MTGEYAGNQYSACVIVDADAPVIRTVQEADALAVAELYGHYVRTSVATFDVVAPTVADWVQRIGAHRRTGLPFLVATIEDVVAGYAYAQQWRPKPGYQHTVEDTIYLAPNRTGAGLGRRLLTELQTASIASGARQMIAIIADTGDDASAALHRGLGFREVGRLSSVGFKYGRWVDTTLMQCELPTLNRAEVQVAALASPS